jgi:outer membrane protein assembly factor BamB
VFSSPAVVGNLLFIGSCSGIFYALDRSTGQVQWSYDIKRDGNQTSFHGDVLSTPDLIIVGTDGGTQGQLYAFERAASKVVWKYRASSAAGKDVGVASDIIRKGARVYGVAQGDELFCLDVNDGTVQWSFSSKFNRGKFGWSNSPVLEGNTVLFGGLDGRLYALNATSGESLWETDLHSPISTTPALVNGSVYVGTKDKHFYRMRSKDGTVISSMALDGSPWWHVSIAANSLLAFLFHHDKTPDGIPFAPNDLISIDLDLKRVHWLHKCPNLSDPFTSVRPCLWNNEVLAGDYHGQLFAFRLTDGVTAWSHQLSTQPIRGIGMTKDTLYVGTFRGIVYAVEGLTAC